MTELLLLAKVTAILAAGLLAQRAARRAAASVRALMLAATFGVLLLLPITPLLVPARIVEVRVPQAAPGMSVLFEQAFEAAPPAPRTPPLAPARALPIPSAATLARWTWIGGAMCFAGAMVMAWLRLRRLQRTALPWHDGDALVQAMTAQAGLRRPVRVFLHEHLSAPMTCGAWRPAIGLPTDAPRWTETELRRAFTHELEHVRRHDWPVHVVARLVCAAYWFHPLAWVAWRQLCLESERACDDAVLRSGMSDAYADQLLALARRMTQASPAPLLSMAGRHDLSARIRAILDVAQARGRVGALAAGAIAAATLAVLATVSPLQVAVAAAQAAPPLAFEVASIRPNTRGERMITVNTQPGGRFVATNVPVSWLIRLAFQAGEYQIIGAPAWADAKRFDVIAKAEVELAPVAGAFEGPSELRAMVRQLLADRFGLVVHRETRDVPGYRLVTARADKRLGPQLTASAVDCTALFAKRAPDDDPPRCGIRGGPGTFVLEGVALPQFASALSGLLRRPVEDATQLPGTFDLDLSWEPVRADTLADGVGVPIGDAAPLFAALEAQAGLRLERTTARVEVYVIDRIERPTSDNEPSPSANRPAGQAPATTFEVASIRRNTSGDPLVRGIMVQRSGRIVAQNIPLRWLIASAYGVHLQQTAGGADWLDSERYDIDARGPAGATQEQVRAMLRMLLAERAHLVVHEETREQPVFALKRVRPDALGAGLRPAAAECGPITPPSTSSFPAPPPPPDRPDTSQGVPLMSPGQDAPRCARMFMPGFIGARQIAIADFVANLRQFVGRPVVDRTGLTGLFDLDLAFAMDFGPRGAPPVPPVDGQPALFTALREQLGLTLEQERGRVQVLVIAHVERPTGN